MESKLYSLGYTVEQASSGASPFEVSASLGPMPLHLTLKMCPVIPQGPENSLPKKLLSLCLCKDTRLPWLHSPLFPPQEAALGPIHSPSSQLQLPTPRVTELSDLMSSSSAGWLSSCSICQVEESTQGSYQEQPKTPVLSEFLQGEKVLFAFFTFFLFVNIQQNFPAASIDDMKKPKSIFS